MNSIATEVANSTPPSATSRKRGLLWAMPVWCIHSRVTTAAGMLPSHRRRNTCQSTLPLCWWIEPPTILVTAANHRSVPDGRGRRHPEQQHQDGGHQRAAADSGEAHHDAYAKTGKGIEPIHSPILTLTTQASDPPVRRPRCLAARCPDRLARIGFVDTESRPSVGQEQSRLCGSLYASTLAPKIPLEMGPRQVSANTDGV